MSLRSALLPDRLGSVRALSPVTSVLARGLPVGNHLATASSTTDGTSFATASISPAAGRLVLLWVACTHATTAEAPSSVTGNGLTWVQVNSVSFPTATRRLSCFRALGAAPSAGAVTINFATSHQSVVWSIVEYPEVDQGGTNGSGAVVQSTTNTAAAGSTSITGTLAALEHENNLHAYGVALNTQSTVTEGGGFTERGDDNEGAAVITLETGDKRNDTTADPTFTSASAVIISVEVKAA